ncbi:hypothetical protein KY290_027454 [Solanum tuberosum]|uniref:Uncharacterized protein n=1 Tax=Solanum tuberosum TaxID=4113 RepID=A0ABQ7UGU9_SOLTU|nr:hypothetical protein KY285_026381 [Solanum tuberosum]KAH0748222.1 hypothetical protein KY290_027454 [Solanum tuberosum]
MYDLSKTPKSWIDKDLKGILCKKTRGFPVVKLSVPSTHMPALYNGYSKRIGVAVRGAKAQYHDKI